MKDIGKEVREGYNKTATAYHESRTDPSKTSFNAFVENPALLRAAGYLQNRVILEAGCGSGIMSRKMKDLGASVQAFDLSEEFIKIARKQNPDIAYEVASSENLEKFYSPESFDMVVSSLMIHYTNIDKSFNQMARVLKPNGKLVFSTAHPQSSAYQEKIGEIFRGEPIKLPSYFKDDKVSKWTMLNEKNKALFTDMPFYVYNFEDMSKALFENGFLIEQIYEPQAIDDPRCDPLVAKSSKRFPWFTVIRATKAP